MTIVKEKRIKEEGGYNKEMREEKRQRHRKTDRQGKREKGGGETLQTHSNSFCISTSASSASLNSLSAVAFCPSYDVSSPRSRAEKFLKENFFPPVPPS